MGGLEGQSQAHSTSKADDLDMLLLNTNRKSHMGNPTAPLDLTLSDLGQGRLDFEW